MKGYIEDKSLYILSGFTKHSDFKSLRVVFPAARGVKWEDEQIHTQES